MPLPPPSETLLDELFNSFAGYPRWLVAAGATIVAVVVIWIFAKLLKWSLYLLMWLVLIGGMLATGWLIFH